MKQSKTLAILLTLMLMLSFALPAFGQDTEPEDADEEIGSLTATFIGTIEIVENGDIVFTTEDGDVFIIAPAGSFNPSILDTYEEGTLFALEGVFLSVSTDDNPPTLQVVFFEVYDVTTDTDEDGVIDAEDNCPEIANADQLDTDLDGFGDACDDYPETLDDADNDGIVDLDDNCIDVANNDQLDTDLDGIGDECDDFNVADDADNDGVTDLEDNCPEIANNDQSDEDLDGIGDACDEDFVEEEVEDDGNGEGGFYCRNRDIEHPAGGRIAEAYEVDYADLIAQFCGDEGEHKVGWGIIRRELQAEAGESRGNGNGNSNGNGNGNSNGNGNGNSNGNSNGNGNGNSNGNSNGNGNGNGNSNGNGNGNSNGNGNGNGNGRGN